MDDHERGCQGRTYACSCGYDDERDAEIERLRKLLDLAAKQLQVEARAAVTGSVNQSSGSSDPCEAGAGTAGRAMEQDNGGSTPSQRSIPSLPASESRPVCRRISDEPCGCDENWKE